MRGLARAALLYAVAAAVAAAAATDWLALHRFLFVSRAFTTRDSRVHLGEPSPVTSVPKALRPGFAVSTILWGEPYRYTVLPCPRRGAGHRSVGPALDALPPFAVAVGDSFTEAPQVSDEQAYPAVLGAETGRRFVNLGVAGQGLIGHIERLQHCGFLDAGARLLLVQLDENDYLDDRRAEAALEAPPKRPSAAVRVMTANPALYIMARRAVARPRPGALDVAPDQDRRLRQLLAELDALARAAGARLLVFSTDPRQTRTARETLSPDADALLLRSGEAFRYDGHWTARGHREVAAQLLERLRALGWLDRKARMAP